MHHRGDIKEISHGDGIQVEGYHTNPSGGWSGFEPPYPKHTSALGLQSFDLHGEAERKGE